MMAHSDGTRGMSEMEFVGNLALLIVGGNDTTRNSMSGGLLALSENPGELAEAQGQPRPGAEPRRRDHPLPDAGDPHAPHGRARHRACRPAHPAGDKVVMWYVSGNRDESVIENPDAFIVDRAKPRQHLSYGAGIHRCVGDRLADLQLRILWEEILARDLDIEVMGPPRRLYSNFIRGIRALPVRIAA